MTWQALVKARIKDIGTTQEKIAETLGVTPGGLGHWLNGRRETSIDQVARILEAVGLKGLVLNSNGTVERPEAYGNVDYSATQPAYFAEYPLINCVQAGLWTGIPNDYPFQEVTMLPSTKHASKDSFWLDVRGDSMTAPAGSYVTFPEGIRILVDPNEEPRNGSFVVAKAHDDEEATFKKFIVDLGQAYLKPLNPDYKTIPIDESICRIIGVVVDAKYSIF